MVFAITIVTLLMMIVIVRALLLAALAVALNLATVGVAFGVIVLLFNVPDGYPLRRPHLRRRDRGGGMFGVVFGLSIDYAVFLLMRMKESYDRDGENAAAISLGLEKTARVITGAAAIMMAVFIAFAAAPIATVSQLGVGLTIAVLLDATVVRIVLLPALMLLLGDRVWWCRSGWTGSSPSSTCRRRPRQARPASSSGKVAEEPGRAALGPLLVARARARSRTPGRAPG